MRVESIFMKKPRNWSKLRCKSDPLSGEELD